MAASYTLSNITYNSVQINLTADSNYAYYTIFVRLTSDTSDSTYKVNHHKNEFPVTITGLSSSTDYTVNIGYNNTGNLSVDGYIGPKEFTTSTGYTAKLYFNANGGSGGPGTVSFTGSSTMVSCTIPTTVPTRSGYTFLGWSTSSSATSPSYYAGSTYTFTGSTSGTTHRLYAVWEERKLYARISYNANGGSSAPSATNVSYATNATSVNLSIAITTAIPTRSNYVFLGWSKSSTATSPSYSSGDKITIQATSTNSSNPTTVTLYAVWTVAYKAKVTFNANGGSGAPSSISATGSSSWVSITLPDTEPTRAGATFLGWSVDADATEPEYLSGVSHVFYGTTSSYYTTTLYAVWYYDEYCAEITYVDRVYEGGGYTTKVTRYYDTDSYVPVTMPGPLLSEEGYVFLGWATSIDATEPEYLEGYTYNFSGKLGTWNSYTLYSVWQATYTVIVTFNANGGSGAPSQQTYTDTDATVPCAFPSTVPTREGYTFLGWAYSSTATSPSYFAGSVHALEGSMVAKEYTFYAVWSRTTRYGGVWINGKCYVPWIYHNGWRKYATHVYSNGWKKTRY